METNVIFDTHACVKRMTEAGVETHVAEAFAAEQVRILENYIATKQDIEGLRKDTAVELVKLETKLTAAIDKNKNDLIKWIVLIMILLNSLLLAAIKIL